MAEYIEREAALSLCGWYNTVNGKSICAARKDELATLPAADVVEVKHGRWVQYYNSFFGQHQCFCSRCEDSEYWKKYYCYGIENFCPNCGADMREVRGDG